MPRGSSGHITVARRRLRDGLAQGGYLGGLGWPGERRREGRAQGVAGAGGFCWPGSLGRRPPKGSGSSADRPVGVAEARKCRVHEPRRGNPRLLERGTASAAERRIPGRGRARAGGCQIPLGRGRALLRLLRVYRLPADPRREAIPPARAGDAGSGSTWHGFRGDREAVDIAGVRRPRSPQSAGLRAAEPAHSQADAADGGRHRRRSAATPGYPIASTGTNPMLGG